MAGLVGHLRAHLGARRAAAAAVFALAAAAAPGAAHAAGAAEEPTSLPWSFEGVFGTFDDHQVQRGLQVYLGVCSNCHSLKYVSYRDLEQIGYDEDQVKAIAAEHEVQDGPDENGDMFMRPARPSDKFVSPYANEKAAAAANGGKAPPDLSLMYKARERGADYIHAILTGYGEAPADAHLAEGANYNPYFPGHQIAMPQPLYGDDVTYQDGTKATLDQEARDVAAFLAWTAEPYMARRHRMGLSVVLFTIVLTGLFYAVKRKVWSDVH